MMRSVRRLPKTNERVILRVDMNVPFDRRGHIADDVRIRESLPTIRLILARGGKLLIVTHRGNPQKLSSLYSIRPIARRLGELLGKEVTVLPSLSINPKRFFRQRVLFLENVRFFPGEQKNSPAFAGELARWGKYYVNDAFGVSHRNAASIVAITKILPSYAGLLLEKEIREGRRLAHPKKPFTVIMGGAKIKTKLAFISTFERKATSILLGGALLNTVLKAKGVSVGRSLVDKDSLGLARRIARSRKVVISSDVVTAKALKRGRGKRVASVRDIGSDDYIIDVGPEGIRRFVEVVRKSKTVVWNGPLGFTEIPEGAGGTKAVWKAIRSSHADVVIGGGDVTASLGIHKSTRRIYISTGGGALLEFIAKGTLPGIKALE